MARGQRDLGLERQWRDRMSHWRASGLSVRDLCLRRGLIFVSREASTVKPGRKWWRFPGENGRAHACSSMKSEDGA